LIIVKKQNLKWRNKNAEHCVEFLGSLSQFGSVHIGCDINDKPYSKPFKDIEIMYSPEELLAVDIYVEMIYIQLYKKHV